MGQAKIYFATKINKIPALTNRLPCILITQNRIINWYASVSLKGQKVTNKRTGLYCPLQDEMNYRDSKPQPRGKKKQRERRVPWPGWNMHTESLRAPPLRTCWNLNKTQPSVSSLEKQRGEPAADPVWGDLYELLWTEMIHNGNSYIDEILGLLSGKGFFFFSFSGRWKEMSTWWAFEN